MVNTFRRNFILTLVLLVVMLGVSTGYLLRKNFTQGNTPTQIAEKEAQDLAERVGMLMVLPTDETPTIATVSDPEALKGQAFFIDAKKGDKVLIYTNAKKAILYDSVINKIITIAPLGGATTPKNVQNPSLPAKPISPF